MVANQLQQLEHLLMIKYFVEMRQDAALSICDLIIEISDDKELTLIVTELKERIRLYLDCTQSVIKANYVKDYYGRAFRRIVELIQLSDYARLNI